MRAVISHHLGRDLARSVSALESPVVRCPGDAEAVVLHASDSNALKLPFDRHSRLVHGIRKFVKLLAFSARVKNQITTQRRFNVKRRIVFILSAVALLLSFSQIVANASDKENSEQQILKTLEQRGEAQIQRDFPTLERLMAEECTYTHASSQTQSKAEFLADLKSGKRVYKALKNTDLHVMVYGDTAVLTGRSNISAVNDGKDVEVATKFLEVYVNRNGDGKWSPTNPLASRHETLARAEPRRCRPKTNRN